MLKDEVHFLLLRAFHYSNKNITQKIYDLDLLPGQPKILEYLLEHNGSTAKEIGKMCVLNKSTITSLLLRMEKLNLIFRKEHLNDKRSSYIYLTDKGLKMAQEVKNICLAVDNKAFQNITSQDKKQFLKILNTVITNLEAN